MTSLLRSLFKFNNENAQYIYLMPSGDSHAKWELIDQEELEKRVQENTLEEGCRLFKVDQELNVRFERTTHIE